MLRWYLSPTPNFFSDWLWPYCDTEPFNYTIKSVCFDFHSTNLGSSVIKQVEVRSLFYPISTCFDIITLYSPTLPCRKAETNAKFNKPLTSTVDNG